MLVSVLQRSDVRLMLFIFGFFRRLDQSSEKVDLTKGNLYYMELLHKENTLIDFMCVGAMFPTLSRERPISSRHLVMESTGTIKDCIIDG